jgi:hypothetical protein
MHASCHLMMLMLQSFLLCKDAQGIICCRAAASREVADRVREVPGAAPCMQKQMDLTEKDQALLFYGDGARPYNSMGPAKCR